MKSFKRLDKPTGIFGISFEDWGVFLSVSMVLFFVVNLLRNWIVLPKLVYPIILLVTIVLFIMLRRSNKQKAPMYLHSRVAWLLTPKKLYIIRPNLFQYDQPHQPTQKKKR
ncbi:hypothetical protein WJR50_25520 [Catalinimonas sp. 4WD22]|uniref:hypothetical protein n=1 Tax=Catalinimonas locisalis TaxID=3133978 RepID=UPI003100F6B4